MHLGLLASPQTRFLGGECLRFGDMVSFNPVSCQKQIDVFFDLFLEARKLRLQGGEEGRPRTQIWASGF